VRKKRKNFKVRQIIILLPQSDTLFSLAEAMSREKRSNKNLPIKAIVTTRLMEEKQQPKKQQTKEKKLIWAGFGKGGSHKNCPLSPLVIREIFHTREL
jgi:hypothetical protein